MDGPEDRDRRALRPQVLVGQAQPPSARRQQQHLCRPPRHEPLRSSAHSRAGLSPLSPRIRGGGRTDLRDASPRPRQPLVGSHPALPEAAGLRSPVPTTRGAWRAATASARGRGARATSPSTSWRGRRYAAWACSNAVRATVRSHWRLLVVPSGRVAQFGGGRRLDDSEPSRFLYPLSIKT